MLNSVIHFIKTTIEHYIIQPCKLKVKICSKLLFEIYVKTRPKRKYFRRVFVFISLYPYYVVSFLPLIPPPLSPVANSLVSPFDSLP